MKTERELLDIARTSKSFWPLASFTGTGGFQAKAVSLEDQTNQASDYQIENTVTRMWTEFELAAASGFLFIT